MAKKDKIQELFTVKGKDVDNIDDSKLIAKLTEEETIENNDTLNEEADEQPVDINALFKKLDINKTNDRMSAAQRGSSSVRTHYAQNKQTKGLINEDYLQNLLENIVDRALEKNIDRIITGVANVITMMQSDNNNNTNQE